MVDEAPELTYRRISQFWTCNCLLILGLVGTIGGILIFGLLRGSGYSMLDEYLPAKCQVITSEITGYQTEFLVRVTSKEAKLNQTISVFPDQLSKTSRRKYYQLWNDGRKPIQDCYFFKGGIHKKLTVSLGRVKPFRPYILFTIWASLIGLIGLCNTCWACCQCCYLLDKERDLELGIGGTDGHLTPLPDAASHSPIDETTYFSKMEGCGEALEFSSTESTSTSDEDPDAECTFCYRRLFSEKSKKTVSQPWPCCDKMLHEECMLKWLAKNDTCIWCRKRIIT